MPGLQVKKKKKKKSEMSLYYFELSTKQIDKDLVIIYEEKLASVSSDPYLHPRPF